MNKAKFKRIALVLVLIVALISLCGCGNMALVDTTWKFDRAVINIANDQIVDGKVQSWTEFDDSDMIQVKIDGVVYLTHSSNVVLIAG